MDTLLLGNGASMAIDPRFSYDSLLETAKDNGLITSNIQKVFEYFRTRDFELVLNLIWRAYLVNQALGMASSEAEEAYLSIRTALVEAIRTIHPEYESVEGYLEPIYEFMKRFKKVISLNYDLIVYWAMLKGNEDEGGTWFKDCFINEVTESWPNPGLVRRVFEKDWTFLATPHGAKGATLVFYPHGNLVLATDLAGGVVKVTREQEYERLLDRIVETWESQEMIPLFVSEGSSSQKERAISRSDYLDAVYNSVLPSAGSTIVTYGWSMQDKDDHILRKICRWNTKRIVVSVHKGVKPIAEVNDFCADVEKKIKKLNDSIDVFFFDAQSPGCWVHS